MEEREGIIYGLWCICHPDDGIRYVGQTIRGMHKRFWEHIYNSRNERLHRGIVHQWILAHGEDNIAYSVLEICTSNELDDREIFWMRELNTHAWEGGLNVNKSGGVNRGFHQSEDHRRKISEARAGIPISESRRRAMLGTKMKPESIAKMKATLSLALEGEGGAAAKLKWTDIPVIHELFQSGLTQAEIGRRFKVSEDCIRDVVHERTWKRWRIRNGIESE